MTSRLTYKPILKGGILSIKIFLSAIRYTSATCSIVVWYDFGGVRTYENHKRRDRLFGDFDHYDHIIEQEAIR